MKVNIELELNINEPILLYAIYRLHKEGHEVTQESIMEFIEWKTRLDICYSLPTITGDFLNELTPDMKSTINKFKYMVETKNQAVTEYKESTDDSKLSDKIKDETYLYLKEYRNTNKKLSNEKEKEFIDKIIKNKSFGEVEHPECIAYKKVDEPSEEDEREYLDSLTQNLERNRNYGFLNDKEIRNKARIGDTSEILTNKELKNRLMIGDVEFFAGGPGLTPIDDVDNIEYTEEENREMSEQCKKQQEEYIEQVKNTSRRSAWLNIMKEEPEEGFTGESLTDEDILNCL